MLGGHDDQRFGAAALDFLPLLVELRVERVAHLGVLAQVRASGDARCVAQHA